MEFKNRIITENFHTPLLLPSFSSKGFSNINQILISSKEYINTPILISLYDLYYKFIAFENTSFAPLLFIDSGGYEASNAQDLSDIKSCNYIQKEWNIDMYSEVIKKLNFSKHTVLVNYDSINNQPSIEQQIEFAMEKFNNFNNQYIIKEFLFKPEKNDKDLNIKNVIQNLDRIQNFDIIGLTEKELGTTINERICNLIKIRLKLKDLGIDKPIHIFGCLDSLSIPLYFLAGADIFDGLTWLRYAFHDNLTIYKWQKSILQNQINFTEEENDIWIYINNYKYLQNLQNKLNIFIKENNYNIFGNNSKIIEYIHKNIIVRKEV